MLPWLLFSPLVKWWPLDLQWAWRDCVDLLEWRPPPPCIARLKAPVLRLHANASSWICRTWIAASLLVGCRRNWSNALWWRAALSLSGSEPRNSALWAPSGRPQEVAAPLELSWTADSAHSAVLHKVLLTPNLKKNTPTCYYSFLTFKKATPSSIHLPSIKHFIGKLFFFIWHLTRSCDEHGTSFRIFESQSFSFKSFRSSTRESTLKECRGLLTLLLWGNI